MRKLALVFSGLLLAAGAARAQEFGAPSPAGEAGHFTLGGALSHSSTDYQGFIGSIDSNRLYAEGSYAFTGDWEGYARLGGYGQDAARYCYRDIYGTVCRRGSYGTKPFLGGGVRGLFWKRNDFAIGMLAQLNWRASSTSTSTYMSGGNTVTVTNKLTNQYDLAAGAAFQWLTPSKMKLYAGPFLYTTSGTQETTITQPGPGPSTVTTTRADYKDRDNFGLLGGIRIPFAGAWDFNAEAQWRSGYVIGAGLSYRF